MPLTDAEIKNAGFGDGKNKRFDCHGLFLWLKPNGSKLWRWKYRIAGIEKQLTFGVYPDISLKRAREACDGARSQLQWR